jgi:hypothetical protein
MSIATPSLYLRVNGRLYPDNRLALKPSFLTDRPNKRSEDKKSPLRAELYNSQGELLLIYHLRLLRYVADEAAGEIFELAVRGEIPFHPQTHIIRFFKDNVQVHEIAVSKGKPKVKLAWKPGKIVKGKKTITWNAKHPEKLPLQYFLRYTHNGGKTWQRVGWRTEKMQETINFDELPGGTNCHIQLVCTDGVNTSLANSNRFQVDVKPCKAMILSPQDFLVTASGEMVELRGQGYYLEENEAETVKLKWISSRDGELGTGCSIETKGLSVGTHRITLVAGERERQGKASITIKVQKKRKQLDSG